jgi:DNA-binding transcriptional LysR family regulator
LSQPAVSQQIRDLERSLGVTLFERRGRGLLLTPAGLALQRLAAPVVRGVRRVAVEMSAYQGMAQGILRIGATATPGVYLLPHALGRFSQRYPGVQTSLAVTTAENLAHLLQEGELDLVTTEQELPLSRLRGFEQTVLLEDEVVLIAPPRHPWAVRDFIQPAELAEQGLILRQKSSRTRQLIIERLSQAGVDPEALRVRFELGHSEAIVHAVLAGLGVGFVSRFAVATERHAGLVRVIPIEGVEIRRAIWLVRPVHERTFVHQERFCELLGGEDWLPDLSDV